MAEEKITIKLANLKKLEGWENLWENNVLPWHIEEVNSKLIKYLDIMMQELPYKQVEIFFNNQSSSLGLTRY